MLVCLCIYTGVFCLINMKRFLNIQNDVISLSFQCVWASNSWMKGPRASSPSCYSQWWKQLSPFTFLLHSFLSFRSLTFLLFSKLKLSFTPFFFLYDTLYSFSLLVPLTLIPWSVSFCLFPPSVTETFSLLTPQVVGWRETCRHRNDVGLGRADAALQTLRDLQIALTKGNKHTHSK